MELIDNEIKNSKKNIKSRIIFKVNALIDKEIIDKLYEASCANVKIELIVRGICGLIPGIKNLSENIKVRSIVGRLLEHSRIFYFENAENNKIYVGSADMMKRNLDKRVEALFPIEDPDIKSRIINMLKIMLEDNVNAREMDNKSEFHRIVPGKNAKLINSQSEFFDLAKKYYK